MNLEIYAAIAIVCLIGGVLAHKYLSAKAVKDAVAKAESLAKRDLAAGVSTVEGWFAHKDEAPATPVHATVNVNVADAPAPEPAATPAPVDVPATHATLDKVIADAQEKIDAAKAAKDKLTADVATATAAAVAAIK